MNNISLFRAGLTGFLAAVAMATVGCTALNQMSEGIADTMQEFGGKSPSEKKSGDGAEELFKKLDPALVTVTLNGVAAVAPAAEGEPWTMPGPVALPTTFSYAIADPAPFGADTRATLILTHLEEGRAKPANNVMYSEKNGPNTALFPGADIDLRKPNEENIKIILAGSPMKDNWYYEAGKEFELELRVAGKTGAAKKIVRFSTAP